jgi:hypothetical protein
LWLRFQIQTSTGPPISDTKRYGRHLRSDDPRSHRGPCAVRLRDSTHAVCAACAANATAVHGIRPTGLVCASGVAVILVFVVVFFERVETIVD